MNDIRHIRLLGFLSAGSVLTLIISCMIGPAEVDPGRTLATLLGAGDVADRTIIQEIRLPRALAAMMVGFALGMSGAALQGLLRNPLAEPGVLGVSAGAALGASLILFYLPTAITGLPVLLPLAAIIGALIVTTLLMLAAWRVKSITTLILIGVGISSFSGALMALLLNLAPNPFSLSDLITWSLGSVANRSYPDLVQTLPFLAFGVLCLFASKRSLMALTLGEATAASLGANLQCTRIFVILGSGLMTGAAVALAGAIGFVGIVAPHLVRPLVGFRPDRVLLPSGLLGGILLVFADIGVRIIPTAAELQLGVVAALVGAPIFVSIIARRQVTPGGTA